MRFVGSSKSDLDGVSVGFLGLCLEADQGGHNVGALHLYDKRKFSLEII